MHENVKKWMRFTLQLMIHLTVQSKDAPEGILMVNLRMHLAISMKMHKSVHVRIH